MPAAPRVPPGCRDLRSILEGGPMQRTELTATLGPYFHSVSTLCGSAACDGERGQRDTGPVSRGSQLTGQLDGEHKAEKAEEGGAPVQPARPWLFLTLWPGAGAAGAAELLAHGRRRAQKARLRPTGPHPPSWVSPFFLFFFFVLTTSGITK